MKKETQILKEKMSVRKRLGTERFWRGEEKWIGLGDREFEPVFCGLVFSKGGKCVIMQERSGVRI